MNRNERNREAPDHTKDDGETQPAKALRRARDALVCDGMPYVNFRPASRTTWNDTEPGRRTCYTLFKLSESEIVELGERVFLKLATERTKQILCCLLLLAYNLKDAAGNSLFGDVSPESKMGIFTDDKIIADSCTGFRKRILETSSTGKNQLAMGYSFIAGSFLMLFSKSADCYVDFMYSLHYGFESFYGLDFPFNCFRPANKIVTEMKAMFGYNGVLKNTLYNLLYAGRVAEAGESIKNFLYEGHLQYTDLAAFHLFVECMDVFEIDNIKLASHYHECI